MWSFVLDWFEENCQLRKVPDLKLSEPSQPWPNRTTSIHVKNSLFNFNLIPLVATGFHTKENGASENPFVAAVESRWRTTETGRETICNLCASVQHHHRTKPRTTTVGEPASQPGWWWPNWKWKTSLPEAPVHGMVCYQMIHLNTNDYEAIQTNRSERNHVAYLLCLLRGKWPRSIRTELMMSGPSFGI